MHQDYLFVGSVKLKNIKIYIKRYLTSTRPECLHRIQRESNCSVDLVERSEFRKCSVTAAHRAAQDFDSTEQSSRPASHMSSGSGHNNTVGLGHGRSASTWTKSLSQTVSSLWTSSELVRTDTQKSSWSFTRSSVRTWRSSASTRLTLCRNVH